MDSNFVRNIGPPSEKNSPAEECRPKNKVVGWGELVRTSGYASFKKKHQPEEPCGRSQYIIHNGMKREKKEDW